MKDGSRGNRALLGEVASAEPACDRSSSEFEKESKDPADLEDHVRADLPKSGDQPLLGDRLEVLALGIAHHVKTRVSPFDLNMGRQTSMSGRARNNHDHTGGTLVQRICRDHHRRATAGLLTSGWLTEINQPDLASPRCHQDWSATAPCSTARSASTSAHDDSSSRSLSNPLLI